MGVKRDMEMEKRGLKGRERGGNWKRERGGDGGMGEMVGTCDSFAFCVITSPLDMNVLQYFP